VESRPLALVIEDNEDQNLVFTTALDEAGYRVESFFDGLIAQKRIAEVVPEMVILDLHLPSVQGNIILGQIRNDPRLATTRVILATADAAFADGLASQAVLVLLKPISFTQLSRLAKRFIKKPKTS